MFPPPRDEAEFQHLMLEVDATLAREGVQVHARELHALRVVALRLGQSILGGPLSPGPPRPGKYDGEDLSKRIRNWIRERYGSALRVDFSIGAIPLPLRGAVWRMRMPTLYGSARFAFDLPLDVDSPEGVWLAPYQPEFNALRLIEGLSPAMAMSFSQEERLAIREHFSLGFAVFNELERQGRTCADATAATLFKAAMQDLAAATEQCVGQSTAYGKSRWDSLQAAEKTIKAFLSSRGKAYPTGGRDGHSLKVLTDLATSEGLPIFARGDLTQAQCSANVRYEISSTRNESVEAFWASARIIRVVVDAMKEA